MLTVVSQPARPPREDMGLAQAAQAGSTEAFEQLVERYQTPVAALCFAMTGNPSLSEELAQEIFIIAWNHLRALREPDRFAGWLFTIARNRIRRALRRRPKEDPLGSDANVFSRELPSAEPSPLDRIIQDEDARLVSQALAGMPEAYRVPLVLVYWEGQPIELVAEALALKVTNVWQRLSRGRAMLQGQVTELVAAAPRRERPGKAFTAAVMAAISAAALTRGGSALAGTPGRLGAGKIAVMGGLVALVAGGGIYLASTSPRARNVEVATSPAASRAAAPGAREGRRLAAVPVVPASPQESVSAPDSSVIYAFDFEDGLVPPLFQFGSVVEGPPGTASKFCLTGTVSVTYPIVYSVMLGHDRPILFHHSEGALLSFDYWVGDDYQGDPVPRSKVVNRYDEKADNAPGVFPIAVSVRNLEVNQNYHHYIRQYVPNEWAHADVPLSLLLAPDKTKRLVPGDRIGSLMITAGFPGGKPFFVDNVKILAAAH